MPGLSANSFNADNQITNTGFTPDGNGNTTTQLGNTYAYDGENRLTGISAAGFTAVYGPDDIRVKKTVGGVTTYLLTDGGQPLVEETMSGSVVSISAVHGIGADGVREIYLPSVPEYYAFAFDPQGNVVWRDNSGNTLDLLSDIAVYNAYGNLLLSQTPNRTVPGHYDSVGFTGQYGTYTDSEIGRGASGIASPVLMMHRYYDSRTGRFINRDPVGYNGGINLYGYAHGNPVNVIDPDGYDAKAAADFWRGMGDSVNPVQMLKGAAAGFKYLTSGQASASQIGKSFVGQLNPFEKGISDREAGRRYASDVLMLAGGAGALSKMQAIARASRAAAAAAAAESLEALDIAEIIQRLRGTVDKLMGPHNVSGIKQELLNPNSKIWTYTDKNTRVNITRVGKMLYVQGGHHRLTAAIEIYNETGNEVPLRRLLTEADVRGAHLNPGATDESWSFPYPH